MPYDDFDEGTPPAGQEPVIDPGQGDPTPAADPVVQPDPNTPSGDPTPPAPASIDPDQLVNQTVQKLQSWVGRRDKQINDTIAEIKELIQSRNTPATPAPVDATTFLDNPDQYIEQIFERKTKAQTQQQVKYNSDFVNSVNSTISSDPLAATDEKFAGEVIAELTANPSLVDRSLPAGVAAKLAIATAKANVLSKRVSTPVNPLNKNKPTNVPTGGVQPSGAPPKPPAKDIKLDEYSANFVKRYGYSTDDVQRVLG